MTSIITMLQSTTTTTTTTEPISIPAPLKSELSYREIIKQLAAQTTTKPYGDIPPMPSKKKKKKQKKEKAEPIKPMRRMSHVEDWIEIDSKESLPDEEELVQSPFSNFLSGDFLTDVLPLHMPPPSLSKPYNREEEEGEGRILTTDNDTELSLELLQEYDDVEDDEESLLSTSETNKSSNSYSDFFLNHHKELLRRHSISSFQNKSYPTSSTTSAISSSPPHLSNTDSEVWKATLAKLKHSLFISSPPSPPTTTTTTTTIPSNKFLKNKKLTKKLIPMPIPPRRPASQKRRSEATTQPRFNPVTNTYLRDTRYNPDHLRMISAELNMIRTRKLLSPLKPRGFLPRRKDAFVRGENRKPSPLLYEIN